jgi:hypothetical protein
MSDARWDSRKRMLAWVHHGIQIVVLLAVLIVLNLLAGKFPARMDMTSRRTYALSAMAEDLLRNLKYDVEIWVNRDPGMSQDRSLGNAMTVLDEMFEEFTRRTDHVKVYEMIGPKTKRYDEFNSNWSAVTPTTVFVLAHLEGNRKNKKTIDISELYQGNATTGEVQTWKGEPVLVQTIRDLGGINKRIVYESEGHRETLTADARKMGTLAGFLRLNEGIEIRRLILNDYKSIPVDSDLLMIMAPEQPFLENELETIKEYIERGGSLLVTMRPKVRTGLEKLLEEYSIKVGENIVLDPQQFVPPSQADLVIQDFNIHEVNRQMASVQFRLPQCCTIDPIERRDNNWTITPLAAAGPGSWEEKGDTGLNAKPKPDADERVGNMKLIVAVEKNAKFPMDDKHKKAKIIVWGSSLPFTNEVLRSPVFFQHVQGQYVVNHFRWLMDRQLLEVPAKDLGIKPLQMSPQAQRQLEVVIYWGFPAFGIGLGLLAWFLRRK